MAVKPEDVRSDLARMVGRPLEAAGFGHLMSAAVRRLPYDGWCLFGLDPHTGLRTFQFGQHGIEQRTAELARNESLMPDVNKYTDLAHSPSPAAWLSTDHPLASSSHRLNELMRPQGFHSEIRLVLCERERTWGALVLFRDSAARPPAASLLGAPRADQTRVADPRRDRRRAARQAHRARWTSRSSPSTRT